MEYRIRLIEPGDDRQVEYIIRSCLLEYGGNHEGTAWCDPDLCRFSEIYNREGRRYWVADVDGKAVGGVGIGELEGADGVCELQKMYCLPRARGTGIAHELLRTSLAFAKQYYRSCYLETLPNMTRAQRFYQAHGFRRVDEQIGSTDHFACDVRYLLEL